ncbi:hypothetical protein [Tianweitania sp.]|nr:hypothetical protein [Tianweitania sp.]
MSEPDFFWAMMITPASGLFIGLVIFMYAKYEDRIWKGKQPPF